MQAPQPAGTERTGVSCAPAGEDAVGLEGGLRRRKRRSLRVVDEVQHKPAAVLAVAQGIELPQTGDAAVEHAVAPLPVDVGRRIARQRCRHLHALRGQERCEVLLSGFGEDGEVASVDHPNAQGTRTLHEFPEVAVQLRRASGEVQRGDPAHRRVNPAQRHERREIHEGRDMHRGDAPADRQVAGRS